MLAAAALAAPAASAASAANTSDSTQVVVQHGGSVQLASALDLTIANANGVPYATSIENGIQMAVQAHPDIRGFPIRTTVVSMSCFDQASDVNAAESIVGNPQYVGVIGPLCSPVSQAVLPIFDPADVVTISGSTTFALLPSYGPHVFNSVAVPDGYPYVDQFDPWYATVKTLPSDMSWGLAYSSEFGSAPLDFADLYYDATSLLIRDLQKTSRIDGSRNLVINRAALAQAVRTTTYYQGVTGPITLDPATGYRVQ
jgi:ABC-type branched-subunit amino acid transport system substrate-binding protein